MCGDRYVTCSSTSKEKRNLFPAPIAAMEFCSVEIDFVDAGTIVEACDSKNKNLSNNEYY